MSNSQTEDLTIEKPVVGLGLKFNLKQVLLPIMKKNRRPMIMALILLILHFLELFSLQIKSENFPYQKGLMPSIHSILARFNLRILIKDEEKNVVLYIIFAFNLMYILSVLKLGFSKKEQRSSLENFFVKFHVINFQIFNWLLLVPFAQFSSYILFNMDVVSIIKGLCVFNLLIVIFMGNMIQHTHININFKYEDFLDSRVDFLDKFLLNLKIIMSLISGFDFYYEFFFIFFLICSLYDYTQKITFYSDTVSKFYLFLIFFFTLTSLSYTSFDQKFISLNNLDISFVLFFSATIMLKLAYSFRDFLIVHKLKIINKYGIRTKTDFDIYIRENYYYLKSFTKEINSKINFLTFFSLHQNKCELSDCKCKEIKMMKESDFGKHKKTFKIIIESYFKEFLLTVRPQDFEEVFLIYTSFVLSVLKLPSKALNLLLVNRKKIITVKNQILTEILVKKCKNALEKKLLNNDQYAQSFSTVVLFDHQVKLLESKMKSTIVDLLVVLEISHDDMDNELKSLDKFVKIGNEVIKNVDYSKEIIKKLLDKNVNNNRLLQLAAMILKYLSEDINFRNFYKQLNIKRINQKILRRKKGNESLDIFDNEAGVIFISLGRNPGMIKQFSKTLPKIFGCDMTEMAKKKINNFMPSVFGQAHDQILNHFINSGKANFLVSNSNIVFGLTKNNLLIHLSLLIRMDTFFTKDFLIGGFIKSLKNNASKTILLDIHGNFINCSKEITNFLDFTHLEPDVQKKVSMLMLIPDAFERILPLNYEDVLLKRNTNFKMKGFLLCPQELNEETINKVSVKDQTYSSFTQFQKEKDFSTKYKAIRVGFFEKFKQMPPQDFNFYRIHFTLVIQNFSNNTVNVRLIEIFEIFEVKDMKLKIQYMTKKNNKFRKLLRDELLADGIESNLLHIDRVEKLGEKESKQLNSLKSMDEETKEKIKNLMNLNKTIEDEKNEDNNSFILLDNKSKSKDEELVKLSSNEEQIDIYMSATNRTDLDKKLNYLNEIQNKNSLQMPTRETKMNENQLASLNNENQKSMSTIVNSFEADSCDLSIDKDDDFEEKISQISNNQFNQQSSEDTLNDQSSKTHTFAASQISRVSSHASGDAKKSTINILMVAGSKKIQFLRILSFLLLGAFIIITCIFFALNQQETFNLQRTIANSGIFHDQLSPICILVRDNEMFRMYYNNVLNFSIEKQNIFMGEIKNSLDFNYNMLNKAYANGVAQADSTVDFIYSTYLNVIMHNLTLYTEKILLNETSLLIPRNHYVPIKILEDHLYSMKLNIPQATLFFLAGSQHLYYSEVLNKIDETLDAYNYVFFIKENILDFIETMLYIFATNKSKIVNTVHYLDNLNSVFLGIICGILCFGVIQICYIGLKTKFKSSRFSTLFFHFQENEIEERINKLNYVLDRYFNSKNKIFNTEISTLSATKTSKSSQMSKKQFNLVSTDKMFLLRSTKIKGKRNFRRSNSLKQMKSSSFQLFLILFLMFLIISTIILLGMYIANYMVTKSFSDNVIDIMGDIESVETYIISIHIRFSLNAILMGLSDDTINRRTEKINKINELLKEIDILQSQITDLTYLFRTRSTSNILTTIKYEFFTNDICLLIENLKATENLDQDIKDIINRIKEKSFCEKLLKNVLTKGSSSFAFDLNEIFNQWRLFLQTNDFSVKSLQEIIGSQDFIDINYSLPYVYALGLNYLRIMLNKSNNYFDEIRVNMIIWFIFALLVCFFIFLGPMKIMINYLSKNLFRSLNLIKLFPFNMIANNKILENKISRMFRMQKV